MTRSEGARRAVAYIRVADSAVEPEAPRAQRLAIEAWAVRERVDVAAWRSDIGVGGATPIAERPGLVAAYRALTEHGARVLVAADAHRFSHDELVSWLIERAALTQGAELCTVDGSRIGEPRPEGEPQNVGWTRAAIDLARAHHRVTLRQRIRATLAEKKARGERVGTVPYGYRVASDGVHLEPHAGEQEVVATVRRLAHEGLSQRAIVARLAGFGIAGRTGAPLRQTQIAKILRGAS